MHNAVHNFFKCPYRCPFKGESSKHDYSLLGKVVYLPGCGRAMYPVTPTGQGILCTLSIRTSRRNWNNFEKSTLHSVRRSCIEYRNVKGYFQPHVYNVFTAVTKKLYRDIFTENRALIHFFGTFSDIGDRERVIIQKTDFMGFSIVWYRKSMPEGRELFVPHQ